MPCLRNDPLYPEQTRLWLSWQDREPEATVRILRTVVAAAAILLLSLAVGGPKTKSGARCPYISKRHGGRRTRVCAAQCAGLVLPINSASGTDSENGWLK